MKDEIIIKKLQSYLKRIERLYDKIKNTSEDEIAETDEALALTQCITNVHALSQSVESDSIAQKLYMFSTRSLASCRNISAHDYDALNWNKVKRLCRTLLSDEVAKVLDECLDIAITEVSNSEFPDYTK